MTSQVALAAEKVQASKGEKQILSDVTLYALYGKITAIMGPSGSGKTTILRYIAGKKQRGIQYSHDRLDFAESKFVAQEDHLIGYYTVDQYMDWYFAMNYGFMNGEEKERQKTEILDMLNLTQARSTVVGDLFRSGLSGGQKRRLSLALELVSNPSIIILDEPTSGLDSFVAFEVIQSLKNLTSNKGTAILLSIHQPSSAIFKTIDNFDLMDQGRLIFHGSHEDVIDTFNQPFEKDDADFSHPERCLQTITKGIYKDFQKELDPRQILRADPQRRTNCCVHFLYLCQRFLVNQVKNPGIIIVRVVMYFMLCFMVGAMFWGVGDEYNHESIVSRTAILFYVDAFLVFMSIAALPSFLLDRAIFEKEIHNGLYSPINYQLAQFFTSWLGIFVICATSCILVVPMVSLNGWLIFFLDLFVSLLIAEGLATLLAIIVPHYIIAMALLAGMYGMFMLCQGFLIVKSEIPNWFIWGYYISFHTYSYRVFMKNEFEDIKSFESFQFEDGKAVLQFYDMEDVNVGHDLAILMAYVVAVQIATSVVMLIKYRKS